MNEFKRNIFKTEIDDGITPVLECFTYNLTCNASVIQNYSYKKCDGTIVNSNIGGTSAHEKTFCAIEDSISTTSSEIIIAQQDLCPIGFPIPISSQSGSNSLSEACGYTDRLLTAYCELPTVFSGSVLYRDIELSIPFGEGSATRFHAITNSTGPRSIELSINGTVLSIGNCT